jgi:hypothetical protein
MRVDLFQQIENGELTLQELSDSVGNLMLPEDKGQPQDKY